MKYFLFKTNNSNYNIVITEKEIRIIAEGIRTYTGSVSEHEIDGFRAFCSGGFTGVLIPITYNTYLEWFDTIGGIDTFLDKLYDLAHPKEAKIEKLINSAKTTLNVLYELQLQNLRYKSMLKKALSNYKQNSSEENLKQLDTILYDVKHFLDSQISKI